MLWGKLSLGGRNGKRFAVDTVEGLLKASVLFTRLSRDLLFKLVSHKVKTCSVYNYTWLKPARPCVCVCVWLSGMLIILISSPSAPSYLWPFTHAHWHTYKHTSENCQSLTQHYIYLSIKQTEQLNSGSNQSLFVTCAEYNRPVKCLLTGSNQ
jgi:hypothetical protein